MSISSPLRARGVAAPALLSLERAGLRLRVGAVCEGCDGFVGEAVAGCRWHRYRKEEMARPSAMAASATALVFESASSCSANGHMPRLGPAERQPNR